MTKMKKILALLLTFTTVFAMTACGNGKEASDPNADTPDKTGKDGYEIAVLAWSLAEEFGVDIVKGAEKKATELGVKVVAPDPAGDMQKEISILEDLIQQKVDAICVAPVDADAIVPYIDKVREAGIVVVDYDIDTDAEVDAKVLSDNVAGGRMAAAYLIEKMGKEGKVLILEEAPGVTTAEERIAGFAEYMEQYPDIEIVRQLSSGTRDTHRATTENMLTAHPDIQAIFCFMGDNTLGAYAACQAMDRTDVMISGYDASPEQVEIMKKDGPDCQIISSVALFPKAIGRTALETAYEILEGKKIQGVIYTENGLLTAENAELFIDKD